MMIAMASAVLLVMLLGVGLLARFALHPMRTLLALARILFFLFGVGMTWLSLDPPTANPPSHPEQLLAVAAGFFGAWLLTFAIPGALRRR